MNDFEFSKFISDILDETRKASRKNTYILKSETIKKIDFIERSFHGLNCIFRFDAPSNSIEITLLGFVFDSLTCNIKQVLLISDVFVIDSLNDGKVCIEMKLLNAAEIIKGA